MRTTITINEIEEALSKAGKSYWKVNTSDGPMNCFDDKISKTLSNNVGRSIDVEIATSPDGKFKNIRGVFEGTPRVQVIQKPVETIVNDKFKEARNSKDTSMYTSYAKDIFCEIMNKEKDLGRIANTESIMNEAISLVKQAKEAFS